MVDESPTSPEIDFQDIRDEAELETRHEVPQEALRFALVDGEKDSIALEETEENAQQLKRRRDKKKA